MTHQRFAGGTAVTPGGIPVILGFSQYPNRVQQYRNFLATDPDILVDPGTNTSIKLAEEVWMVWDEETGVRFVKRGGMIPDTMADPVVFQGRHATGLWVTKLRQTIRGIRSQNGHGRPRNGKVTANGKSPFVRHSKSLLTMMGR